MTFRSNKILDVKYICPIFILNEDTSPSLDEELIAFPVCMDST